MRSVAQIRKLQAEKEKKEIERKKKEKIERRLQGLNTSALYPDASSSSEEAPKTSEEVWRERRRRRRDRLAENYQKRVEKWLIGKKKEVETTGNQDEINIHIAPRDHDFRPRERKQEVGPEWKSSTTEGYVPERDRVARAVAAQKRLKQPPYDGGHTVDLQREREPSKELGGPLRFGTKPISQQERIAEALKENSLVLTEPITTKQVSMGYTGHSADKNARAPEYRPQTPAKWVGRKDFMRHVGRGSATTNESIGGNGSTRTRESGFLTANTTTSWTDPHKATSTFRQRDKSKELGGDFVPARSHKSRPSTAHAASGSRSHRLLGSGDRHDSQSGTGSHLSLRHTRAPPSTSALRRPGTAGASTSRTMHTRVSVADEHEYLEYIRDYEDGLLDGGDFDGHSTSRARPSTARAEKSRHTYYNAVATIVATGNTDRKNRPSTASTHGEYSSRRAKVKDALKVARSRPVSREWK